MTHADLETRITGATAYEEFLVPALFAGWAERVAAAAKIDPGTRVLDVACGTGVLARAVAAHAGASGSVTGVDLDPGMVAVARRLAPTLAWKEGSAESLPFPNASFDVVVSQFALMFFADKRQALREMLRVLVPGGRLCVAVWAALEDTPPYATEVALLERYVSKAAADALRLPFALGNRADVTALFASAGVESVAIATLADQGRFPSIRAMLEADIQGWLPLVGIVLTHEQHEQLIAAAERELAGYLTAEGECVFEMPGHVVTGRKA